MMKKSIMLPEVDITQAAMGLHLVEAEVSPTRDTLALKTPTNNLQKIPHTSPTTTQTPKVATVAAEAVEALTQAWGEVEATTPATRRTSDHPITRMRGSQLISEVEEEEASEAEEAMLTEGVMETEAAMK